MVIKTMHFIIKKAKTKNKNYSKSMTAIKIMIKIVNDLETC